MSGFIDTGASRAAIAIATLGLAFGAAAPAAAQSEERVIANPPTIADQSAPAPSDLEAVAPTNFTPHEKVFDLDIVYADGLIFNPMTLGYDKVHLRSYNGTGMKPDRYVSPTIEVVPGDTIRVNLKNDLPPDPSCTAMDGHMANHPHCFNGTNLHTHGLWVNPAGNGDNVLLSINPGVAFQYEYNIPGDHPAGTFWYHTHRHGSTALQVSSGMAGALIVRGNRLPTAAAHGDVDTLLKGYPERILVMQQIQYACRGAPTEKQPLGPILTNKDGTYSCPKDKVGAIEDYDLFSPGQWNKSGRYTSLNGAVLPTFHMRQGQIERWRMIHAGVRDTIAFTLVKMAKDVPLTEALTETKEASFIKESCTGARVPFELIAADGLTMGAAQQTSLATFQPGYRFDALIVAPEPGRYCLVDASSPRPGSVDGSEATAKGDAAPAIDRPRLMGFVTVTSGTLVGGDIGKYVTAQLVAKAQAAMPPAVAPAVVADLKNGLKLTSFVPHPDIEKSEVTGTQQLTFFIDTTTSDTRFEVGNTLKTADAKPYDPGHIDRKLTLGGVDEWTLQSHFVSHPYHIHVNPFQIVSILDPNGKDVSEPGSVDDYYPPDGKPLPPGQKPPVDPQYAGLKGVWKDTLWIKSFLNNPTPTQGIYTITVRTRYQRYIGEYVLHCHILDHEDSGMMQNVAVVLPTGPIKPVPAPTAAAPTTTTPAAMPAMAGMDHH